MCTVLLPLGVNQIAIKKYIISYIISYHIISYHITSYHIIYHTIPYRIISYIISYHIISYHIISYVISYHNEEKLYQQIALASRYLCWSQHVFCEVYTQVFYIVSISFTLALLRHIHACSLAFLSTFLTCPSSPAFPVRKRTKFLLQ